MTILVCGEALYDVFTTAESDTGFGLDARLGGSAFNLAIGLARLGRPAGLLTGISTDFLGDKLVRALAREGVATQFLARKTAPTTLALISLHPDGSAQYGFYGEGAADRAVTEADLPRLDGLTGLCFGCFSLLTKPTGDSFLNLARRATGGPLIALDPNIRATVEPDMAVWRNRVAAFAAQADLVKISMEDMAQLYPETAPADVAQRWLTEGLGLVVMTRGKDGAVLWSPDTTVDRPAPAVTVVDTVGAGDGFLAALLTALAEVGLATPAGLRTLDADRTGQVLDFAIAAAGLACTRRGADLPHRGELPGPTA